jgi:hypothetical protein
VKAAGELPPHFNWYTQTYAAQSIQAPIVRRGICLHLLMILAEKSGFIFWLKNQRHSISLKVIKQE